MASSATSPDPAPVEKTPASGEGKPPAPSASDGGGAEADADKTSARAGETNDEEARDKEKEKEKVSRFQKFVTTYSTFLSSFVIGAAGLVATAVYQSKQQDIASRQADAQIRMSEINSDNQWKIERAEILSKNLAVLSSNADGAADQRYGVLLSLTRGQIIDPELAVSYALELGNSNPDYMSSVLQHIADKDYLQLDHAFTLTCAERFGATRALPLCDGDKLEKRSNAIAALVADELTAGNRRALKLLEDERQVQTAMLRRAALFDTYLSALYDRRLYGEIEAFEALGPGAHLVSAIDLAADEGEMVTDDEAAERAKFHAARQQWLEQYALSRACNGECKGRIADLMLTNLALKDGAFDHGLRALLERPDPENNQAESRMHERLLWCRVPPAAVERLRDHVLVPLATSVAKSRTSSQLEDSLDLLALVPPPTAQQAEARAAWDGLLATLKANGNEELVRHFGERHDAAERQRRSPPPLMRAGNFCGAKPPLVVSPTEASQE